MSPRAINIKPKYFDAQKIVITLCKQGISCQTTLGYWGEPVNQFMLCHSGQAVQMCILQ